MLKECNQIIILNVCVVDTCLNPYTILFVLVEHMYFGTFITFYN